MCMCVSVFFVRMGDKKLNLLLPKACTVSWFFLVFWQYKMLQVSNFSAGLFYHPNNLWSPFFQAFHCRRGNAYLFSKAWVHFSSYRIIHQWQKLKFNIVLFCNIKGFLWLVLCNIFILLPKTCIQHDLIIHQIIQKIWSSCSALIMFTLLRNWIHELKWPQCKLALCFSIIDPSLTHASNSKSSE